jgi:serine/threonine-protein kinase
MTIAAMQGSAEQAVFGEYVILEQIGQGGMGVVWKARHRRMDRLVAVKMLTPAAVHSPQAVERFHREVQAAARLSHPNLVAAYDAGQQRGVHYLVMEYVEGRDLAAVLNACGPLSVPQAVDCILQAARGLHYAHQQGVVHRDIKPGNLLLDPQGRVKILDMGLARFDHGGMEQRDGERLTRSDQIMGTGEYMAPEQALDMHDADARSDIYALGCTLYRLLTGEPPYQGDTFTQLFLAHRESPIPSLTAARPEVPETLDAFFRRMVAKLPADRYPSMAEVIADLERTPHAACLAAREVGVSEVTAAVAASPTVDPQTNRRGGVGLRMPAGLRQRRWLVTWAACAGLAGMLLLGVVFRDSGFRPAPALAVAPFDARQAKEHQSAWAGHLGMPVEVTNSIGMRLSLIPPGEFEMGSASEVVGWARAEGMRGNPNDKTFLERLSGECPRHRAEISRPFYLAAFPVTQGEYQQVMGVNPSAFCDPQIPGSRLFPPPNARHVDERARAACRAAGWDTGRHPVETVSWNDAVEFCRRLSAHPEERAAGRVYRLPTEAEWEYACRAGTTTRWWYGDDAAGLGPCAWFGRNADQTTHPVGEKRANPWGLFDTYGNVWQWCGDYYDPRYYERSTGTNPPGPTTGTYRVARGGPWGGGPSVCRSAYRSNYVADGISCNLGFRVALVLPGGR